MKEIEKVVRFEIGEPVAVVLGIVSVMFFATVLTIGGCWVDAHHKVEAIKASNEPMEVYDNLSGNWKVRVKRAEK